MSCIQFDLSIPSLPCMLPAVNNYSILHTHIVYMYMYKTTKKTVLPMILGVIVLVPHVRITKLHCYCKHCTLYILWLTIHGLVIT